MLTIIGLTLTMVLVMITITLAVMSLNDKDYDYGDRVKYGIYTLIVGAVAFSLGLISICII